MRRTILALAVASMAFAASSGAQAQSKPVYEGPVGPPVVANEPKPVGPRVYGYYEEVEPAPMVEVERPSGPGGCGEFFYWNGERCVDARDKSF